MSNRKNKVFSISMNEKEFKEIESYVEELQKVHGFTVSRNELIRRAVLAHVRFVNKNEQVDYMEIFKKVVANE